MKRCAKLSSIALLLAIVLSLLVPPVSASPDSQFAPPIFVVNTSFLNVRTGPSAQFAVLTTVVGGTELPVLGTTGDSIWYQVSTPVGVGWVNAEFVLARGDFSNVPLVEVTAPPVVPVITQLNPPAAIAQLPNVTTGAAIVAGQPTTVTTYLASARQTPLNVYAQPNSNTGAITTLYDTNRSFTILDRANGPDGVEYLKIDVPNVGQGWVDGQKVTVVVGQTTTIAPASSLEQGGGLGPVVGAVSPVLQSSVAIVNTSFLNIRSGPGAQYTVAFTARGGSQFPVIGLSSDGVWFLVQGAFGQGWVNNEFVIFRGTIETIPIIEGARGNLATPIAVIGSSVQLYAAPGTNFGLLGAVAGPVEAPIVARTSDFEWIQINTSAGFGWVLASQVTLRGDANLIPVVAD